MEKDLWECDICDEIFEADSDTKFDSCPYCEASGSHLRRL